MEYDPELYPALREIRIHNLKRRERELVEELKRIRARLAEDLRNLDKPRRPEYTDSTR